MIALALDFRDFTAGILRVFEQGFGLNHGDFIACLKGGKAVGLFVHEAQEELVFLGLIDDGEVGAMDVDGIVLGPGEDAVFDGDLASTAGEMEDIRPSGAGAESLFWWHDSHSLVSDPIGELADDAHPGESVELTIRDRDVLTAGIVRADDVAEEMTKLELVPNLELDLPS